MNHNPSTMKRLLSTFVMFVLFVVALNAQQQHVIQIDKTNVPDTILVFTPTNYAAHPNKPFPVVYLLHGWMGSSHQWNDITDCQALADQYGFILVCPDGLIDSWYLNSPVDRGIQYSDFFFQQLMPYIDAQYRTDKENRFITGLSMGGHGALYLFEQQPDLFRSAGSLSGVLDLSFCPTEYGIPERLIGKRGRPGRGLLSQYSVSGNIQKIVDSGKSIVFSCGSEDRFYPLNNSFQALCAEKKINSVYIITPGGHDYPYWKSAIGFHLDHFKKQLKRPLSN